MRRFWTDDEDERLTAVYGTKPTCEVASALGRSMRGVYNRAMLLGLTNDQRRPRDAANDDEIQRLNADGWSDTQVGLRIGRDRHFVALRRKALKLPSRAYFGEVETLRREGVQRQLDRLGVEDLASLRLASWAAKAKERGWPDTINGRPINMRFVQILDLLYERGPQTRSGISESLGMRTDDQRRMLKSNGGGGSYIAELMRIGLVVCLGRIAKGRGRGKSVNVYSLAMDVEKEAAE